MSAALVLALAMTAAQSDAGAFRQLGAHEHGHAVLLAAATVDGGLEVLLTAPGADIYGAEGDALDEAMMAEGQMELAREGLVSLDVAASCRQVGVRVGGEAPNAGGGLSSDADHAHDHEHAHEHDHAHDQDHDHDHGHDHSHDAAHDHEHGHIDVEVSFSFECGALNRAGALDVSGLFETFPSLEEIDAQFYDGARSAAGVLTPARPTLNLR